MNPALNAEIDLDPIPIGLAYASTLADDVEVNRRRHNAQQIRKEIAEGTWTATPHPASDLFHERSMVEQRKLDINTQMKKGIEEGLYVGDDQDKAKLEEEAFQIEGARDYLGHFANDFIKFPQYYDLSPENLSHELPPIKRKLIKMPFGDIDLVYPEGTIDDDGLKALLGLQMRNYEMFFKGIGDKSPVHIKTYVAPPNYLRRPYAPNNVAIIQGNCIAGVPSIHPGIFTGVSMHEQIHAYAHKKFGIPKAPHMIEALTTLLERYWLPGQKYTNLGGHPGFNELTALHAVGELKSRPDLLFSPEMLEKNVRSTNHTPRSEYNYRYALNILISAIEYLELTNQASSSEEAIRKCVQIYADTCESNQVSGRRVKGILPSKPLVENGLIGRGVKSSDIVKAALRKNGINPSDPKFLEILYKHQISTETPVIPNKFH